MRYLNFKAISIFFMSILLFSICVEAKPKNLTKKATATKQKNQNSVTEIKNSNDFEKATKSGNVVVKFYADWCPACRSSDMPYKELANEIKGIKFLQVNVDENGDLAKEYNVMGIPHFVLFEEGKKVKDKPGFGGKETMATFIKESF